MLLAATAITLVFALTAASAQSNNGPPADPGGYYSQSDHDGYYDRNGNYIRYGNQAPNGADQGDNRPPPGYDNRPPPGYDNGPPPGYGNGPPPGYDNGPPPETYRQGVYEQNCRRSNNAAGTIFGAIAGGLIGSAASHGHAYHGHGNNQGGAIVGGAILGGLLGNVLTRDMPCEDHSPAFSVYAQGLEGPIGQRYEWRNRDNDDYGYFIPDREFRRDGYVCRSFSTTTYRGGHSFTRSGSACRMRDGNWRFD
jgi:surface antigen